MNSNGQSGTTTVLQPLIRLVTSDHETVIEKIVLKYLNNENLVSQSDIGKSHNYQQIQ